MRNFFIIFAFSMPLFFSCIHTRKTRYFNTIQDSAVFNAVDAPEHIIRENDVLSITINSIDPEASKVFNMPNQAQVRSSTPTGDVMEPAGYLVNKDGYINFLMIGSVKAEGLTKEQLSTNIRNAIIERKLLLDPVVEVRHLNYRVTVLGEVNRPTVITVPNEKITLLEALGLAGDITIFGVKTNVMVIRTEGGRRITNRIDLNSTELFNSPYYYLKHNDIVYVEANKARALSASRLTQLLPAIVSSLSVLIVVIDRLTR